MQRAAYEEPSDSSSVTFSNNDLPATHTDDPNTTIENYDSQEARYHAADIPIKPCMTFVPMTAQKAHAINVMSAPCVTKMSWRSRGVGDILLSCNGLGRRLLEC